MLNNFRQTLTYKGNFISWWLAYTYFGENDYKQRKDQAVQFLQVSIFLK